jgi:ribosomal protein S27AE
MTRLKTKSEFEKIQCPKCGSKKTVLHTGIVSLYLKFACGECGYGIWTDDIKCCHCGADNYCAECEDFI